MKDSRIYNRLSKSLAQLVSLTKMYDFEHPIVSEKMGNVYKEVSDFIINNKRSIMMARAADILLINGEKVDPSDKLMAKFVADFVGLELGSIELEHGISREEFSVFIYIMCRKEGISGIDNIKRFLSDKKVSHITPRAATFKLVRDDEDIVRKGEFIKVEDLPPGVMEKFSRDFKGGNVAERLKTADKDYRAAAHNPVFLAELALNHLEGKSAPQDLEKILWFLADYLIDEIGTAKEEEMNRKVLEDVKKKLLTMWQGKPEKKEMVENVKRTYTVIGAALQLKGLVSLYKRHKKELESAVGGIKDIMKNLPPDSQLYRKTKEHLAGIGFISVDESTFNR